jgi:hypothetical protein
MVNLIDIEAKDSKDTTPDPLMAMIFFFIATSIYCVISIFMTDTHQRLIAKVCYILFVIVGEYFINLSLTTQMCGKAQWRPTMFMTLIPWILIFVVLHLFLTIFPGWNSPFSNTFGYLVAKLMGLPELMKKILEDPDNRKGREGKEKTPDAIRALVSIQADNSLFINELYTEPRKQMLAKADNDGNPINPVTKKPEFIEADQKWIEAGNKTIPFKDAGKPVFKREKFDQAWDKLESGEIVKKFPNKNERDVMKDKLYHFVQMKYTIAEYVWNLLTGFLVTSISYNYILNTGCAKSPKEMKERYDQYEAEEDERQQNKKNKDANEPDYTQT